MLIFCHERSVTHARLDTDTVPGYNTDNTVTSMESPAYANADSGAVSRVVMG